MPNIVKNTTFIHPFNLIAPHSCRGCGHLGSIICQRCKNDIVAHPLHLCPSCKAPTTNGKCKNCPNLPPCYIVGERSGLINTLIHDFKYNSTRAIASPIAELFDHILPTIPGPVSIVPLPTIGRHIRSRGFDHTKLIAKKLARIRGANYQVANLLLRTKNTVQVGTNRATRLTQANSAYIINPSTRIDPSTTYLLLDDVWTTGASMQAAIKKLRQAGAEKIIVAILALSRIN